MPINEFAVLFDGIDRMRHRPSAFIRDRGVERRQIEWPYRLRPENEWVESDAILVDLQFQRESADPIKAEFGFRLNPAKETGSCLIAGILERLSQRNATK